MLAGARSVLVLVGTIRIQPASQNKPLPLWERGLRGRGPYHAAAAGLRYVSENSQSIP